MLTHKKTYFAIKVALIGLLIAGLVYSFHPAAGHFSIIINGEPVANPMVQLAAFPALLAILLFTGILTALTFFGVGLFMFLSVLVFMLLGVFIVAPYTWPVLIVIFIMIIVMSLRDGENIK